MGEKLGIKQFLKDWKPKDLSKDERSDILYEAIPDMISFYIKKGHKEPDVVSDLFDKMENEKFSKTLMRILKQDDTTPIEYGLAVIINDFIEKRHEKLDEELVSTFSEIIDKILKSRIKEVSKKLDLSKDFIKELLVIVPDKDCISDNRFVGIYVQRILRKLYILALNDNIEITETKQLKKLFKTLFDQELLNDIAINILLERKDYIKNFNENQMSLWNLITTFALEQLESIKKKKDIREILKEKYISRREFDHSKGRDNARRIQLSQVNQEEYPHLFEAIEDLSEKEKFKNFL
jgi:hypothetical protein